MEDINEGRHFWLYLLLGAKNVGIVLHKTPNPHNAMQGSRGLIAMTGAKLSQTQGQIAVRLQPLVKHLNMAGAIHRLHGKIPLFRLQHKHIVSKLVGVTRLLPQRQIN